MIAASIPVEDIYCELFRRGNYDFITVNENGVKHEKQEQALKILADEITKEPCYGGAAGGAKSWTGCTWLTFMCKLYPGTRWFIGREELKRLRESTLMTFFKICKRYGITGYKYNGQDHFIQFENGSRIDLLDLKYLPSDPLYERYGSVEYTGGWIEEAGEVNFGAYDTLKSRVGRHLNDQYRLARKIFVTCNPKKNWLYSYFFDPSRKGSLPHERKFLQALINDNPFRESDYEKALMSITEKSKKERLLFGNWDYDDDPSVLMNFEEINDCFSSDYISGTGQKYITVDVARYGDDSSVIIVWDDLRAEYIIELSQSRTSEKPSGIAELNNRIVELQRIHVVPKSRTIADDDGIGGGLVDINGCIGFVNNSSPVNLKPHENYANLRSQCYFKLAEIVGANQMYIRAEAEAREKITQELGAIKEKNFDSDEKKKAIISREDIKTLIGRSPDYASSIMLRMFFLVKPPLKPAKITGSDRRN